VPRHFKLIETARKHLGPIENSAVDELLAGRIGRRDFLRHGSVLGLSPVPGQHRRLAGLGRRRRAPRASRAEPCAPV
jgi:peptide/nickel transport system substrate-binding protein